MFGLPTAAFGGGDSRRPLGLAVVVGLLTSQVLTLYLTPVIYIYFDKLQNWLRSRRSGSAVQSNATHTMARDAGM